MQADYSGESGEGFSLPANSTTSTVPPVFGHPESSPAPIRSRFPISISYSHRGFSSSIALRISGRSQ